MIRLHQGRTCILAALLSMACLAEVGLAAARQAVPLSDQPWQDRAYGLSVRPPVDTKQVRQSADDALVRFIDRDERYQLTVSVKRSSSPLTLEQVVDTAVAQVKAAQGAVKLLKRRPTQLAGRPAVVLYFATPRAAGGEAVLALAIVAVDAEDSVYCMVEAQSAMADIDLVSPTFVAFLQALQIADQKELKAQRMEAIKRTSEWLKTLTVEQLHAALIPEQTFRLVGPENDVGYMRIHQRTTQEHGQRGIGIEVQYRLMIGQATIDSDAKFFLADDRRSEIWSITTTRRQPPSAENPRGQPATFVETGVLETPAPDALQLRITFEGPTGSKTTRHPLPPVGYLSRVESHLLGQLLPIDEPAMYGLFWYHSNKRCMTYRTEKLTATRSGYKIETHLSPNEPALTATYDRKRKIASKQLSDQVRLIPAHPKMIQQRWKLR